ncbi:hypothetical protein D1Z97_03300 [Riemerella anatipestifer]|uniref:hypothetical protein n=1 Tax=Riemerella anatipestifer TaxID=34085 RepID=UPI00129E2E8C|nr:hypothetical protein [Riemerella anatipestifer]MBT0552516.1 hypothetical protein [Riemerella anatipestifer]MBT0554833.1 hypothetical protein [Riemerella anatipestifer]MCQ4154546.1 hypothetical protein [Riemerella anatipestifer]MCQ4180539.1 hypothetical protein [Riemerella anatipestifer]MCU7561011.1 hypothetical protein [Riemerella anatipestifer]
MSSICSELTEGLNVSCQRSIPKRYVQKLVLINFNDIDRVNSTVGNLGGASCDYTVQMVLKEGKRGVLFQLPENGSSIKGFFAKSTTDNGFVEYLHQLQLLIIGASKEVKCKLDKLDHGRFVGVTLLSDGTYEVYGWENGISTGDYTYDIVEGGGGSIIPLQSDEKAKETMLPLVYKPASSGNADADFDSLFENAS